MKHIRSKVCLTLITFVISTSVALAREINPPKEAYEAPKNEYSPFVDDYFRPAAKRRRSWPTRSAIQLAPISIAARSSRDGWTPEVKLHEKIYDVAVSDDRDIGADGRCWTPVGNTVDLEAASWTNTIGASELATVWTDPDFDPTEPAFYYTRVLEIPTPRWVVYDKVRLGAEIPEGAELIGQERAYTSPIWYTP